MFQSVSRHSSKQSRAHYSSRRVTVSQLWGVYYVKLIWESSTTEGTYVTNAAFIQNSNRVAFSVDCIRKFSERVLSTPVCKTTSKLFGSRGYSDYKNCLDVSSNSLFVDFAVQFCFRCKFSFYEKPFESSGVIFLDQSQFFATHNNQ